MDFGTAMEYALSGGVPTGQPGQMLRIVLSSLLGLVGAALAIAILVRIAKWLLDDVDDGNGVKPVVDEARHLGGIVLTMVLLIGGGFSVTRAVRESVSLSPDIEAIAPGSNGWLPASFEQQAGNRTLGEMINAAGAEKAREREQAQADAVGRATAALEIAGQRAEQGDFIGAIGVSETGAASAAWGLIGQYMPNAGLSLDPWGLVKTPLGYVAAAIPGFNLWDSLKGGADWMMGQVLTDDERAEVDDSIGKWDAYLKTLREGSQ